jgi:fused signal recognition particle receptor
MPPIKFGWSKLFRPSSLDDAFWEGLEERLIEGDCGAANAARILADLRERVKTEKITAVDAAREALKSILRAFFAPGGVALEGGKLNAWVMIGVNGVGKTTTLAKFAHYYKKDHTVLLGAADTFRAAAREQLSTWAERLAVECIGAPQGADAASVAYDTVSAALARNAHLALIDTAGRLHTRDNLLDQLGKLIRAVDKFGDRVVRRNLLVLDATQGQAVLDQARIFRDKVGVDGIVLTKVDTQARGGTLLAISEALQVPVTHLTHGEGLEDISPFGMEGYLESLI